MSSILFPIYCLTQEFGGKLNKKRTGNSSGAVYSVETPSVIDLNSEEVLSSYHDATFDQELAKENQHLEFLSVNHPLVRAIVDYCLDGNWIDGQTTVKRMTDQSETPGLLCNFRLGYETADESDETEEFVPLFVTCEEEIESEIPETNGSIPPDTADEYPQVQQVAEKAETLIEMAEREAQRRVEEMAEEAEKKKAKQSISNVSTRSGISRTLSGHGKVGSNSTGRTTNKERI